MQSTSTDGGQDLGGADGSRPSASRTPAFTFAGWPPAACCWSSTARPIDSHEGPSQLTAWLSEDDGKTWKGGLMLDERKGISYPDGFQAPDGTIYISYDRNRATDGEILLARFTEEDILARKLVGPKSKLRCSSADRWLANHMGIGNEEQLNWPIGTRTCRLRRRTVARYCRVDEADSGRRNHSHHGEE